MTTGPTLPHLQTALSISLPDKGQPRRPERKQSWPRVQSWTTGDFSQVPSVSTNLEEHPPPELSGRMETPCEPGPVGRHQARLPAELWRCGQSNQTSALVISLYSNEFKFTCKTGYSYWFEHVAPEQPRLCLPSPDLSEEHRHGKTGLQGSLTRGPRTGVHRHRRRLGAGLGRALSVQWGQSFSLGRRTSPGNTGGDDHTAP